jgi:hypothetical protein
MILMARRGVDDQAARKPYDVCDDLANFYFRMFVELNRTPSRRFGPESDERWFEKLQDASDKYTELYSGRSDQRDGRYPAVRALLRVGYVRYKLESIRQMHGLGTPAGQLPHESVVNQIRSRPDDDQPVEQGTPYMLYWLPVYLSKTAQLMEEDALHAAAQVTANELAVLVADFSVPAASVKEGSTYLIQEVMKSAARLPLSSQQVYEQAVTTGRARQSAERAFIDDFTVEMLADLLGAGLDRLGRSSHRAAVAALTNVESGPELMG